LKCTFEFGTSGIAADQTTRYQQHSVDGDRLKVVHQTGLVVECEPSVYTETQPG